MENKLFGLLEKFVIIVIGIIFGKEKKRFVQDVKDYFPLREKDYVGVVIILFID